MVCTVLLASSALAGASTTVAAAQDPLFQVTTNSYTFGQAPVWDRDGRHVVFHGDAGNQMQIFRAALDGSGLTCLTCGQPAPNMVPQVRPGGDKILYHSWRGHSLTIGAPGFGGLGSNLVVANPDGSHPVQITTTTEGEDDYHAYWSPDGRQIVWAHLNYNFATDGGRGQWDVRVADYVDDARGPHLENVRVVRPANGHYYETQHWAPDGSGFLYTESVDSSLNLELFFFRVRGPGPQITRLTTNPAWDEQAAFTPDMRRVVFMSTRDHPQAFNLYAQTGQAAGIPADQDYLTVFPLFEAGFLQPALPEATDLYAVTLATGGVQRLTHDGDEGWIIPEFDFDPSGRRLLWTELKYTDGLRVTAPVDAAHQLAALQALAQAPPALPSPTDRPQGGPGTGIVLRTRIGEFGPSSTSPVGITGQLPRRTCLPRRRLIFPVRQSRGGNGRVLSAVVYVNGRRVKSVTGHNLRAVSLARLPAGRIRLKIVTRTSRNFVITSQRNYRACTRTARRDVRRPRSSRR